MSEARDMQKAAIIMARAAELNAKVAGMAAENAQRAISGDSPAFIQDDFDREIEHTGCHWNSICELIQGY